MITLEMMRSGQILKVDPMVFADRLHVWQERKRKIKDSSKIYGLSNWNCHQLRCIRLKAESSQLGGG